MHSATSERYKASREGCDILRYDVPLSMIVYTRLLCSVEIEAMEVSETQKQALSEITSYASRT